MEQKQKPIIFTCDCGHPGFMEVDHFSDDEFWFMFVEEPRCLIDRIKSFFKSRRYISELLLDKQDVKKLIKYLESKL